MEQTLTDAELDKELGTTLTQFTRFRVLSVDNGIDMAGTDATGKFVEKKYNQEESKVERIQFGKTFTGVILGSKAQVVDKAKYPSWRTQEFDPVMVHSKIDIFPLEEGKVIKDPDGTVQKSQMTYRQLKAEKCTSQPNGSSISTYNYLIILYVALEGEVVKLKFKGTSRGNYFDYNKSISREGFKLYDVNTIFAIYKDTDTGKYAIKFSVESENNMPTPVMPDDIRGMRVEVAESFKAFADNQIAAPSHGNQLIGPDAVETTPAEPVQEADNSEIRPDEIVGPEQEEVIIDTPDGPK